MRTLVLMVAFGLGTALMLPRPARSLDNCVSCDCKQMKAWMIVLNAEGPYGMRMIDPMDPMQKNTIPVEHVPAPANPGRMLSTAADAGVITSQGITYKTVVSATS